MRFGGFAMLLVLVCVLAGCGSGGPRASTPGFGVTGGGGSFAERLGHAPSARISAIDIRDAGVVGVAGPASEDEIVSPDPSDDPNAHYEELTPNHG